MSDLMQVNKNVYKHFHCSFSISHSMRQFTQELFVIIVMIVLSKRQFTYQWFEKFHYGDLVVKFNGNHVNLIFNVTIYARTVLWTIHYGLMYLAFSSRIFKPILWIWMFNAKMYISIFLWTISLQACLRHIRWKIVHKNGFTINLHKNYSPYVLWMRPTFLCSVPLQVLIILVELWKTSISWQNNA